MGEPSARIRTNVLILIAVFVLICGFWAVFLSRTQAYQTYLSEPRLKATLESFQLPPKTTASHVELFHLGGFAVARATYVTDLPFDGVKAHYKTELARHGFAETPGPSHAAHFCGTDYGADLVDFSTTGHVSPGQRAIDRHMYTITILEGGSTCR